MFVKIISCDLVREQFSSMKILSIKKKCLTLQKPRLKQDKLRIIKMYIISLTSQFEDLTNGEIVR